jgi:hypothetical protein
MISPQVARMMLSNMTQDPEILAAADLAIDADDFSFGPVQRADLEILLRLAGKKCYHAIATKQGKQVEAFLIL